MTTISIMPAEESTAKVTVTFTDEDGASTTPTAVTWALTDAAGNVINSREDVAVTPAASVSFLLTGDDLAIGSNGTQRVLLIEATYNSTLGSGVPLKSQATFRIQDLVAVT